MWIPYFDDEHLIKEVVRDNQFPFPSRLMNILPSGLVISRGQNIHLILEAVLHTRWPLAKRISGRSAAQMRLRFSLVNR